MGEIRLFRVEDNQLSEIEDNSFGVEKDLQKFFETNLQMLTGIKFIKSEYEFTAWRGRRPDSLGMDEDGRLVVIEYKLEKDENIIKQGLEYLYYFCHHEAEVLNYLRQVLGPDLTCRINIKDAWLLCVAKEFTHQDLVAAKFCKRRVELLQYQSFNNHFVVHYRPEILLPSQTRQRQEWLGVRETEETEPANDVMQEQQRDLTLEPVLSSENSQESDITLQSESAPELRTTEENESSQHTRSPVHLLPDLSDVSGWDLASPELRTLFEEVDAFACAMGGDVRRVPRKEWIAYKSEDDDVYNIMAVTFRSNGECLQIYAAVNPSDVELETGFLEYDEKMTFRSLYRCPLKIIVRSKNCVERAKPHLLQAYKNHRSGEHLQWDFTQPEFSNLSGWKQANLELRTLLEELSAYILALGSNVQAVPYNHGYLAFKGFRNIAVAWIRPHYGDVRICAAVDPATVPLKPGFTQATSGWPLSHNRLEIIVINRDTLEQAKPLLRQAYEHDLLDEPFRWVHGN